jgi:hypothetical protein
MFVANRCKRLPIEPFTFSLWGSKEKKNLTGKNNNNDTITRVTRSMVSGA